MSTPKVAPLRMEPWIDDYGEQEVDDHGLPCWLGFHPDYPGEAKWFSCPYGQPGDRLWVRETWATRDDLEPGSTAAIHYLHYRASYGDGDLTNEFHYYGRWRSAIFMPRWASRITLELTSVRVERVQDISEADAQAEGVTVSRFACWGGFLRYDDGTRHFVQMLADPDNPGDPPAELEHPELERLETPARERFYGLWNKINGKKHPWESNPWVWVIAFKRI